MSNEFSNFQEMRILIYLDSLNLDYLTEGNQKEENYYSLQKEQIKLHCILNEQLWKSSDTNERDKSISINDCSQSLKTKKFSLQISPVFIRKRNNKSGSTDLTIT